MMASVFDGETDMALGVFPTQTSSELRTHTLFIEEFMSLADQQTLPKHGTLDLETWLSRPHVLVAMQAGDNEIEQALNKAGVSRQIAITLPHWGVANQLIAGTDLILTAARRSFDPLENDERLQLFAPPIPIAPFDFQLLWHQRKESDPAHNWLRKQIIELVSDH